MKLFIDTANLEDIEWGLRAGFVRGVTTNPSLLAKEPKGNYLAHLGKIVDLMNEHVPPSQRDGFSLSVEVFSDEPKEMVRQATEFSNTLKWKDLAVKVHIDHNGKENLAVIHELAKRNIAVNATACMTVYQALAAAAAGARYVSLFWGRIRDGGTDDKFFVERNQYLESKKIRMNDFDPSVAVRETRDFLDRNYPNAEIIAGSIRAPLDVKDAGLAGAHIVTVQPKTLRAMLGHFKTDEVVDQFFNDFKAWLS
ncbi:MAG: hypothetical protein A3D67_02935 [Candidatus Lloydbacteria bacterium RIFCSPHIGHO2_02_FULL_51_22]|uniref:Transaldolase n=2 Tax=Candidatus Lloydiibacteriota TaxID=1817910 RepID=A0A1G2DIP2_9BACT|nr:MAG: hypothetical protein A3D67_02935 [Candidatus Lloydbacteria bacterium RIFCSPHIGHO2_02_FULL_51_22]OGZ15163.1 MAG: hypothetical protein A3J08_02795 [Candidatus Lloydbacteria bacterium RIFCSPLOWO2_02_FULL_51_11]